MTRRSPQSPYVVEVLTKTSIVMETNSPHREFRIRLPCAEVKDMIANPEPYRMFPIFNPQERAELKASIAAVGLRCPVIVDEHGNVIDGHERRSVCDELGIDWMVGADVRPGLTEYEKKALAIDFNLRRRSLLLTMEKRNELLDIYLIANPHLSETIVAELFGFNQSHVNRRKNTLMSEHKLEKVLETIGKDGKTRKVGNRQKQPTRLIVKSMAEFNSLRPALETLGDDVHGLIRRPKKLEFIANRKLALEKVNESPVEQLPQNIRIEHCDFHDLQIKENSVNAIITDVDWRMQAQRDWRDLAQLAKRWLRKDGLFCSMVGTASAPYFDAVMSEQLRYQTTIAIVFPKPAWPVGHGIGKQWRPAPVFAKSESFVLPRICDTIFVEEDSEPEKDYHDWQQRLDVCMELMRRLTKPGDVILDPFVGTGTNAVAAKILGQRTFIGCDINEQQVRTAVYRVSTEGTESTVISGDR